MNLFWKSLMFSVLVLVDGKWSPWSKWTACSASCGAAKRSRLRDCNSPPPAHGGKSCEGSSKQEEYCSIAPCKGETYSRTFIKFSIFLGKPGDNHQTWNNETSFKSKCFPGLWNILKIPVFFFSSGCTEWSGSITPNCFFAQPSRTGTLVCLNQAVYCRLPPVFEALHCSHK